MEAGKCSDVYSSKVKKNEDEHCLTLSLYDGNSRYSIWLTMNGYMPNSSLQNSHMAITIR